MLHFSVSWKNLQLPTKHYSGMKKDCNWWFIFMANKQKYLKPQKLDCIRLHEKTITLYLYKTLMAFLEFWNLMAFSINYQ